MATAASTNKAAASTTSSGSVVNDHHHEEVGNSNTHHSVSASVGHDHWANDVLKAVADRRSESVSPNNVNEAASSVQSKVNERKRKFHSERVLELKNLPEGCTEQVRQCIN